MIDALEVGISLVLSDGVGEGTAAAERTLRALDLANSEGAVSVRRLREVASDALYVGRGISPPVPPQAKVAQAASTERGSEIAPGLGAAIVKPNVVGRAFNAHSAGGATTAPKVVAGPLARPLIGESSARSGIRPVAIAPREDTGSSAPSPRDRTMSGGAPTITILRMESAAPRENKLAAVAENFTAPRSTEGNASSVPFMSAPSGRIEVSTRMPQAPTQVRQRNPAAPDAGPGDVSGAQAVPRSVGVSAIAGDIAAKSNRAAQPVAAAQDRQAIQGDVYLDGALVGRWMSNYMAREASRASAGPTGFSSRRDPLRPGATVGA